MCEAFPISDLPSLQLYASQGCTVVVGDLYIADLPQSITRGVLLGNLGSIQYVRGDVYFRDNQFIVSMVFLDNLVGVRNIHLENNAELVDARMVGLVQLLGNVTVDGCDRLCPARYAHGTSSLLAGTSQAGCANATLNYFLWVQGTFNPTTAVPLLGSLMACVLRNVTDGQCSGTGRQL